MTADTAQTETLHETRHETSLAVWDIAPTVAAGERFAVKVGAKSSAGCALGGCRIEVLDERCCGGLRSVSATRPGPAPTRCTGPRSNCARRRPRGLLRFSVRFDAGDLDEPHQDASSPFNVSVVARPEHTLTVTVASGGVPIEEACIRLGPYRATTDGRAGRDQTGQGPLRACGLEGGIRHGAGAARDRRGRLRRCRGAGVAAGRSRRGLDGVSAVI